MLRLEEEYGHIKVTIALIDFEDCDDNRGSSCAIGRSVVAESGEWVLARGRCEIGEAMAATGGARPFAQREHDFDQRKGMKRRRNAIESISSTGGWECLWR
jgi:hypothetical protein